MTLLYGIVAAIHTALGRPVGGGSLAARGTIIGSSPASVVIAGRCEYQPSPMLPLFSWTGSKAYQEM